MIARAPGSLVEPDESVAPVAPMIMVGKDRRGGGAWQDELGSIPPGRRAAGDQRRKRIVPAGDHGENPMARSTMNFGRMRTSS